MIRTDSRKVKELWVINSVADPRPTLETYKYMMAGEKEAPVDHLYLFDAHGKNRKRNAGIAFQRSELWGSGLQKSCAKERDDDWRPSKWLGSDQQFYFTRTGRDLKKVDVRKVDITYRNCESIDRRAFQYLYRATQAGRG